MKPLSIVIIGAGNLAYHLVEAFSKKAEIIQVFNHRRSKEALALSKKAKAELVTNYHGISKTADAYIVCVKDEAIAEVAKSLGTLAFNGMVLHTSGSTDIGVLKTASIHYGVFYPLQTFSVKDQVTWKDTPVLVEGNSLKSEAMVKKLAKLVSGKVVVCNSEDRMKMHLAAVLSCNFSNALYTLTSDFMAKEIPGKSFDLLRPLIKQTVFKLDRLNPAEAQTGPAKRGDKATVKKHLALLKAYPQTKAVYQLMTAIIQNNQQ